MDRLKPERGGETLPFYAKEWTDPAECWARLFTIVDQHIKMDHLDKETLWHVKAWMELLMLRKPIPLDLHEPDDIPPRYLLQTEPEIDSDQIALEFYRASQSSKTIDGKGRREV